jgi:hypothetical protein
MKGYLQPVSFLQNLILKSFGKPIVLRPFHLRHFTLMLLFCLGGDADYDFIDKSFATGEVKHNSHSPLFAINHFSILTSSTDYFRSRQNGNWSVAATWESSPDNINWQLATEIPTKDANIITIQSGHTVIVSNSISLDQAIINGKLEFDLPWHLENK